jgi:hypothetical protein
MTLMPQATMKLSEANKEIHMKRLFGYALILASLSIPAFAAKNSHDLTLATPVKVGATQLSAGEYKLTWTGTGSNVQVTIAQKGKTPVTVPAKATETKNGRFAVTFNKVNGVDVLESIQLDNLTLQITGATSTGE